MIEEYHFGSIIIDGKTYNYDVETGWNGEVVKWRRGESHIIDKEDVKRAIDQDPDIIVIGTGESGTAQVTEQTKEAIKSKGIELIVDLTEQATKTFNIINDESEEEEGEQRNVIGLFHITC